MLRRDAGRWKIEVGDGRLERGEVDIRENQGMITCLGERSTANRHISPAAPIKITGLGDLSELVIFALNNTGSKGV
jgi:hypothetical protein